MTSPEPVAVAPVIPTPQRNRLGTAALVLALAAIGLPILFFIVFTVAALLEGAEGDDAGYAVLGAFFLAAAGVAVVSPIAIAALVLGIVAVTRRGRRKAQAVAAIILSVLPASAVFFLPAAIDSVF